MGVVTGVNGILFRPSFFVDSQIFDAPSSDYFGVDDIWYSGNLASASVERWVVPFLGSGDHDRNVGWHLGDSKSVIDSKLKSSNRAKANTMTIRYFADAWEKGDGEEMFWSEDDRPKLRGFLPFRHWVSENIIRRSYSMK